MANDILKTEQAKENVKETLIRDLVLVGDLGRFTPDQKVEYYNRMCDALELNPVTRPFEFMVLKGKTVLYALKGATEQLRKKDGISVIDMKKEFEDGLYIVTVTVQNASGRRDMATGIVDIKGKTGDDKANLMMKGETKAKRRATLSISGLGMLDETEIESIPAGQKTENKPKGILQNALNAIKGAKTLADIDRIKSRIPLTEWTELEGITIDDALKNAELAIKEGTK